MQLKKAARGLIPLRFRKEGSGRGALPGNGNSRPMIELMEPLSRSPVTPVETLAVAKLKAKGRTLVKELVRSVASDIYSDEVRSGGWALDIGLLGPGIFYGDIASEIRAQDGILWRIEEPKSRPMGYFPILVDMRGRRCLVIGGGEVATRKVESLLEVEASVLVISPSQTDRIKSWAREGKIRLIQREYQNGDLAGHDLAFVATDDTEVNRAVFREGRERGIWVNAADDPEHCDFILPSILRRGDLIVAVATGGASPALSRAIREELENYFTGDYAVLASIAAEVRRELKNRSSSPGPEAWHKVLNGEIRELIRQGEKEKAKSCLLKLLGA